MLTLRSRYPLFSLAAIGLVAVAWWSLEPSTSDAAHPGAAPKIAAVRDEPLRAERANEARAVVEDAPSKEPEPAVPEALPAAAAEREISIRGRVLGLDGEPRVGVGLGLCEQDGARPLAWSATDGTFQLELTGLGAAIGGVDRDHATLRASRVLATNVASEHVVVVAPARDVVGRVVDELGNAVAGAQVRLELPEADLARIAHALDTTEEIARSTESDADGRFALPRLPVAAGLVLSAAREGHVAARAVADPTWPSELELVLTRATPTEPTVEGLVLHADGRAAAGALVQLDRIRATTDATGHFELSFEPERVHALAPLVASLRGFWPAVDAQFGARVAHRQQLSPVRLVLGAAALSIRGRVVDASGGPLAGWNVAASDATVLAPNTTPITYAEDLAGEGQGREATSGADGSFELHGLADREYALQAIDRSTLVKVVAEHVRAGSTDVVLTVPLDAALERVAGRVVGADGLPIADVRIAVHVTVDSAAGARVDWIGAQAASDQQGRFELARVPRKFAVLALDGDAVVPVRHKVEQFDLTTEIELRAARRCRFRVVADAETAEPPTSVRLLALDGTDERIEIHEAQSWSSFHQLALSNGASQVVCAAEGAHVLVFLRMQTEVARRRIELVPGEVLEIRP